MTSSASPTNWVAHGSYSCFDGVDATPCGAAVAQQEGAPPNRSEGGAISAVNQLCIVNSGPQSLKSQSPAWQKALLAYYVEILPLV